MRTREYVVKEEIYSFDELSDSAKENARQKYLEEFRESDDFSEMVQEDLTYNFPKSDLQVECSLSGCQGDGLNVYGVFAISDICEYVRLSKGYENLSKQEKRFLNFLGKSDFEVKCDSNNRYTYYTSKVDSVIWNIEFELESEYFSNIPYETIEKIAKIFDDRLEEYCRKQEEAGYDFFYKVEDEEIVEIWEANEYEGWDVNGNPIYT
jgi:hypothetical protein